MMDEKGRLWLTANSPGGRTRHLQDRIRPSLAQIAPLKKSARQTSFYDPKPKSGQ